MRFSISILSLLLLVTSSILPATAQEVPHEIAGIKLGSSIHDYPDIMESNFLKETVVTDWHGFRKGVISYGTCKYPGQIVKIDMKYEDGSKDLYQELLKRFRAKFGAPALWKGDSFGVMHIWKWQFTDSQGNKVSLNLQHNQKNTNETMGNMIKLSYPDRIEEERQCFNQMCEEMQVTRGEGQAPPRELSDWSYLVPR